MRGGGIVAAVCGLALLVTASADAAAPAPHPNCHPPEPTADHGGSQRIRVFSVLGEGGATYACDRVTGTREELFRSRADDPVELDTVRTAGRVVAYRQVDCFGGVCDRTVRTLDLRSRRPLTSAPVGDPLTDLVLYPTGVAAWIAGAERQVAKVTANGVTQPLDAGPGVEPGSLAASVGSVVFWMKDGEPRWAYLDDRAVGEPPSDPAFGGKSRCYPRRSRTAAGGRDARLYRVYDRGDRAWHLFACNLRTGRRALVSREVPRGWDIRITQVRFAGRFAAVAFSSCYRGEHCQWGIRNVDLASGRVQRYSSRLGGRVTDLVLAPSGALAWIAEGAVTSCSGRYCIQHGFVVDRTLALSPGGRMYWFTFDGRIGTAPLD